MAPSTIKPGYDAELHETLKIFPAMPPLTAEVLEQQRAVVDVTPEMVMTDPSISYEEISIPGPENEIKIAVLRSRNSAGGARPAVLHIHGGGMICGSKLFGIQLFFDWIKEVDLVVFSVGYRLAPEFPAPAALEDCYATLKYISQNASDLGIDPDKIMVAGGSAGGGLSAGVALMARDRGGPQLLAQCLIYPMLDDRMSTVSSTQYMNEGTWTGRANRVAWDWYLSGKRGRNDISVYAAPARATVNQLRGLPQAWIDVGSAELFRDEDVAYASKLWEAGVQTELHVWPGAWHGFDMLCPGAALTKTCLDVRLQWVKRVMLAGPPAPPKVPAVL